MKKITFLVAATLLINLNGTQGWAKKKAADPVIQEEVVYVDCSLGGKGVQDYANSNREIDLYMEWRVPTQTSGWVDYQTFQASPGFEKAIDFRAKITGVEKESARVDLYYSSDRFFSRENDVIIDSSFVNLQFGKERKAQFDNFSIEDLAPGKHYFFVDVIHGNFADISNNGVVGEFVEVEIIEPDEIPEANEPDEISEANEPDEIPEANEPDEVDEVDEVGGADEEESSQLFSVQFTAPSTVEEGSNPEPAPMTVLEDSSDPVLSDNSGLPEVETQLMSVVFPDVEEETGVIYADCYGSGQGTGYKLVPIDLTPELVYDIIENYGVVQKIPEFVSAMPADSGWYNFHVHVHESKDSDVIVEKIVRQFRIR